MDIIINKLENITLNLYSVIKALYKGIENNIDNVIPQIAPQAAAFIAESVLERVKKKGINAKNAEYPLEKGGNDKKYIRADIRVKV